MLERFASNQFSMAVKGDYAGSAIKLSHYRLTANGYTLVNLAASYDLGNGLSAYGRIDNLFDRRYQNPIGFQQPGLGVYAGVRFAFDTASRSAKPLRRGRVTAATRATTVTDPDGATVEIFPLPTDESSLEQLLRDLFGQHWDKITFGPLIQGAAWEIRTPHAPTHIGMLDGYLTVAFGLSHFHLCIGPHRGPANDPAPEALARHRRTARAELYRRLDKTGAPVSWGLRLFNGHDEQQTTILLPNPFLAPDTDKILQAPDWSRLNLWDRLRARWLGLTDPDPLDRSGRRFSHG
jgi:hypothetical protein